MRRFLLLAAAGAAALVVVVGAGLMLFRPQPQATGSGGGPMPKPAFVLIDQDGRTVREADLEKKPTVLFFGYTFCPDVCPTTLARLTALMKDLGPAANRLNVDFVTIDPARDTPKQLKLYLSSFDHRIQGLTGSAAAVDKAAKEYGVYFQKEPLPGGGYTMDHSSAIYLVNRKSGFSEILAPDQSVADQLDALKRLTGSNPA